MREFFRQFICGPGWLHAWPKWADEGKVCTYQYPDAADLSKRFIVADYILQHRRCGACGLLQSRRVKQ